MKRNINLFLVLSMVLALLPVTVFAEGNVSYTEIELNPSSTNVNCGYVDEIAMHNTCVAEEIYTICGLEDILDHGSCGENLSWEITSDGVLTVFGSGPMDDYSTDDDTAPWSDYQYTITAVIIEDGVTSIGKCAFFDCGMESLSIPNSLTAIGNRAFELCTKEPLI